MIFPNQSKISSVSVFSFNPPFLRREKKIKKWYDEMIKDDERDDNMRWVDEMRYDIMITR